MRMSNVKYLLKEGFKNVWSSNRMMSIASIGVLVACMLIIGVASALSLNVDKMLGTLEQQNIVMVYYTEDIDDTQARALTEKLSTVDNVSKTVYVSKEEGLKRQLSEMGDEYKALFSFLNDDNPLPNGAQVYLKNLSKIDTTVKSLKRIEGVSIVRHQAELAEKIVGIRRTVTEASIWITALLLVISLVIISNTIKITMYSRKLEISIMKAVGATDYFIRLPFMVEGAVIGLISAAFTEGLLYVAYRLAETKVESYLGGISVIPFRQFALPMLGMFIIVGVVVGLVGSRFTIAKYLRREGSEFSAI